MHAKLRNACGSTSPHGFQFTSVSGQASLVTMVLVLARECIWDILEKGLEAGGLAAVPPRSFRLFNF